MYDFAWTRSATLVALRTNEEFLKYGYGDFKVQFTVPINWIDILDIFVNFRLQEPFGLDGSGNPPLQRGEFGRYYYVESLNYNFMKQEITVIGIDMQYLLSQCMIVPHCGDVAEKWEDASVSDKMYAYVGNCVAESFVFDGAPLKKICNCIVA